MDKSDGDTQNISAEEENNNSNATDLQTLEQKVKAEEANAAEQEQYYEKKYQELQERRENAKQRKKDVRNNVKQVKQELNSDNESNDGNEENKGNEEDKSQVSDNSDEQSSSDKLSDEVYNSFKERYEAEKFQEEVESQVDKLVRKYPEATADQLNRVETLVSQLREVYSNKSASELIDKAVQVEIGTSSNNDHDYSSTAPFSSPSGSQTQASPSKYRLNPSMRQHLLQRQENPDEYVKRCEKLIARGHNPEEYGLQKI